MGAYFGKQGERGSEGGGGGGTLPPAAGDGQKKKKNAPAASWLAATGLVKSQAAIFTEKKSACGKMDSSNRACQIPGGHFHRKKSACGKMDSGNRACQSSDHGCMMDFDNRKVTFRTDRTPMNRIALQF